MSGEQVRSGIASGRLEPAQYAANFADLHPVLSSHEARVEADRCYFCHDAPCMTACPTHIDIPMFIRQIASSNPLGAAETIFSENIFGGMCARVCPTETLCEEVCVREIAEGKPVKIGQLQRFATDAAMAANKQFFARAAATGRKIAVVGAGPAGLSCGHRLAMLGHLVTVYEKKDKPGGLNEFGIAAYKAVDNFAQAEVEWLLQIGGISIEYGKALGRDVALDRLRAEYDAVFVAIGLGAARALDIPGAELDGVDSALDFISRLRQAGDLSALPVGREVVVIGGGMTAIDAAVQAKLLGARSVTLVYRRDRSRMPASVFEQDLAAAHGVHLIFNANPVAVTGAGSTEAVTFEYTSQDGERLVATGETFSVAADQVLVAIGQVMEAGPADLAVADGAFVRSEHNRSSLAGVWVGGDCARSGDDLTVSAVQDGKVAALSIHESLMG
ncbi:MAG: NAD(P)-dependent oxidoreductase [Alphaproteobacteria bacterium]|nr:NAD(P)-dependent oxidoreductase [Alphaproteobacteria bacterium]